MSTSSSTKYPFLEPASAPDDLGTLGPYRVIDELGRGGMGYVFRAEDTRLKRVVALKMMNQKVSATNDSRMRFLEEARSMAAVKHDNVATIYEVNDQFATPFMAMELLSGETLESRRVQTKKFDYATVIGYATQIARGLSAAHARGIIHRDIKPANIWIESGTDRIKILDFGLALAGVTVDQLAGRGSVIGTPQYLSPEQASSEPLDDRTDLYSLGVVLFEMCAGRLPFRARNVAEQLIATLVHRPVLVSQHNPEIPEPLAVLIAQLLEKEPYRRLQSAVALEARLDKVAVECESKSDVAQAINKLQSQLSAVVTNKPDPFTPPPVVRVAGKTAASETSPFETLPPLPPIAAPGAPFGNAVRGTAVAGVRGPNAPRTSFGTTPKEPVASPLVKYWPVFAIGGVGLIMAAIVGGVWYGTLSASRVSPNMVMLPSNTDIASPASNQPSPTQAQVDVPPPVPATPPIEPTTPATRFEKPNNGDSQPNDRVSMAGTDRPPDPTTQANNDNAADLFVGGKTSPVVDDAETLPRASNPDKGAEEIATDQTRDVKPVVMKTIQRRTGDGRGADTTVDRQAGKTTQLGDRQAISIQSRGSADLQHSYIRFEFSGDRPPQNLVGVELVLTLPGNTAIAEMPIRIYGVPESVPDTWTDRTLRWDNAIANDGFDSIPLLAETTVSSDPVDHTIRVSDDRITEFVSQINEPFVTFIIAGGGLDNKPVYFVSKEGREDQAPTLELMIGRPNGREERNGN